MDKGKIETILINIIGNALKFTEGHNRILIKASLEHGDHPDATLSITVQDFGIGIPLEKQELIFERFFQINESHKELGTGIGLALVKELLQLLQGSISVSSKPGEGSEFTMKVPIVILSVDSNLLKQEAEDFSVGGFEDFTKETEQSELAHKILIVEDNTDLRKFIISSLDGNYYFFEAGTGLEGYEKAVREIPELIISDIMMPIMDGIAMSKKIKKDFRTSHIPILFFDCESNRPK